MVLLVRHAERDRVTDMRTHEDVMLTGQGKADAVAFGRAMGRRFGNVAVSHSPVPRCRQTAESLSQGVLDAGGTASFQGPLPWVPGVVTTDFGWVNDEISRLKYDAFLRSWFDDGYGPHQITTIAEAAARQIQHVLQQLRESSSPVTIDVLHDWHLLLLREHHLHLRHEDVGIPPYLDSVVVFTRGASTFLWTAGRCAPLETL